MAISYPGTILGISCDLRYCVFTPRIFFVRELKTCKPLLDMFELLFKSHLISPWKLFTSILTKSYWYKLKLVPIVSLFDLPELTENLHVHYIKVYNESEHGPGQLEA